MKFADETQAGPTSRRMAIRIALRARKSLLNCVKFYDFYEYFMQEPTAAQGNGEPYNITDGYFVVGNITECS